MISNSNGSSNNTHQLLELPFELRKKYQSMRHLILILLSITFVFPNDGFSQKKRKKQRGAVEQQVTPPSASVDLGIDRSSVFDKSFTGFALYDPENGKMLYEYNSDKYFTPASNTKILTFFTGLQLLGDSIPALQYKKHGDMMVFLGDGRPFFFKPTFIQK